MVAVTTLLEEFHALVPLASDGVVRESRPGRTDQPTAPRGTDQTYIVMETGR